MNLGWSTRLLQGVASYATDAGLSREQILQEVIAYARVAARQAHARAPRSLELDELHSVALYGVAQLMHAMAPTAPRTALIPQS